MDATNVLAPFEFSTRLVHEGPQSMARNTLADQFDLSMNPLVFPNIGPFLPLLPPGYSFNGTLGESYGPITHGYGVNYSTQPTSHHSEIAANVMPYGAPRVREARNGLTTKTPPIKLEEDATPSSSAPLGSPSYPESGHQGFSTTTSSSSSTAVPAPSTTQPEGQFATSVDVLMRAIQAKAKSTHPNKSNADLHTSSSQSQHQARGGSKSSTAPGVPNPNDNLSEGKKTDRKAKKKYQCSIPGCWKSFYQKTHLDIHTRAHTGVKPFVCREPSCGQRFSQMGNLKTHERRHTGERPYECDICHKTFAQRGNVRAHKIVHQQAKPFTCRLDDCGKQFSQLGNLKSHQNKFHAPSLNMLTERFASLHDGDSVSQNERELWEYFSSLYKNSNKGIKGRGKDRRISCTSSASSRRGHSGGLGMTSALNSSPPAAGGAGIGNPESCGPCGSCGHMACSSSSSTTEYHDCEHDNYGRMRSPSRCLSQTSSESSSGSADSTFWTFDNHAGTGTGTETGTGLVTANAGPSESGTIQGSAHPPNTLSGHDVYHLRGYYDGYLARMPVMHSYPR